MTPCICLLICSFILAVTRLLIKHLCLYVFSAAATPLLSVMVPSVVLGGWVRNDLPLIASFNRQNPHFLKNMLGIFLQTYVLLDNIITSRSLPNLVPKSHFRSEGERKKMEEYIHFQRYIWRSWGLPGCLQNKCTANFSFRLIYISKLHINNTENTMSNSLWIPGVWKPKKKTSWWLSAINVVILESRVRSLIDLQFN